MENIWIFSLLKVVSYILKIRMGILLNDAELPETLLEKDEADEYVTQT